MSAVVHRVCQALAPNVLMVSMGTNAFARKEDLERDAKVFIALLSMTFCVPFKSTKITFFICPPKSFSNVFNEFLNPDIIN